MCDREANQLNVFTFTVMSFLFVFGTLGIGTLAAGVLPPQFKSHIHLFYLLAGLSCVFTFTWPIYRFFGYLPAPSCPRRGCPSPGLERVTIEADGSVLRRCQACGQLLEMRGETVLVLDEDETPVACLKLASPKFLGIWRRRPLKDIDLLR